MKKTTSLIIVLWFFSISAISLAANSAEQWRVTELTFTSDKSYQNSFSDVDLDVVFKHNDGIALTVPAFWDGGNQWKVRFAPTLTGKWTYTTICSDESNAGLHNKKGELACDKYQGDLDLYKHGFVTTKPAKRYFIHNDGTPFFYLGDTHWNFPVNTLANFKTIVDKRVEQGFTVIQSEPIGAGYDLTDGLGEEDIPFFNKLDERFRYVADKGLVHANAQLFFAAELGAERESYPDDYLEKLCRYWVARYCAFPVMWTTAQEADNDFYHDRNRGESNYDGTGNPWKLVAGFIHHYDPYHHPLTAHQENINHTVASNSSFRNLTGHTWYGAQWSPKKDGQLDFDIPKDYWDNGQNKPTVNLEGHYDHLWTKHDGARMQGWTAFLNGMYGHGYGAIDIWLYNSTYDMHRDSHVHGITITIEDKKTKWQESLEFPSAWQMGYMHDFFRTIEWWKLVPRFDDLDWFINDGSWYSLASEGNDLYVVYFYNPDLKTGTIRNLNNAGYTLQWYDPVKGEYSRAQKVQIKDGSYVIGDKPSKADWVLVVKSE